MKNGNTCLVVNNSYIGITVLPKNYLYYYLYFRITYIICNYNVSADHLLHTKFEEIIGVAR